MCPHKSEGIALFILNLNNKKGFLLKIMNMYIDINDNGAIETSGKQLISLEF